MEQTASDWGKTGWTGTGEEQAGMVAGMVGLSR